MVEEVRRQVRRRRACRGRPAVGRTAASAAATACARQPRAAGGGSGHACATGRWARREADGIERGGSGGAAAEVAPPSGSSTSGGGLVVDGEVTTLGWPRCVMRLSCSEPDGRRPQPDEQVHRLLVLVGRGCRRVVFEGLAGLREEGVRVVRRGSALLLPRTLDGPTRVRGRLGARRRVGGSARARRGSARVRLEGVQGALIKRPWWPGCIGRALPTAEGRRAGRLAMGGRLP